MIFVLVMLVLLPGLVLAFFSRAAQLRQTRASSKANAGAAQLSDFAPAMVLGDCQSGMEAGSEKAARDVVYDIGGLLDTNVAEVGVGQVPGRRRAHPVFERRGGARPGAKLLRSPAGPANPGKHHRSMGRRPCAHAHSISIGCGRAPLEAYGTESIPYLNQAGVIAYRPMPGVKGGIHPWNHPGTPPQASGLMKFTPPVTPAAPLIPSAANQLKPTSLSAALPGQHHVLCSGGTVWWQVETHSATGQLFSETRGIGRSIDSHRVSQHEAVSGPFIVLNAALASFPGHRDRAKKPQG